jgi:cellulose synthase/poly-beta-1,6-N-acetylglucosamine synthase-like glycosyltransferase
VSVSAVALLIPAALALFWASYLAVVPIAALLAPRPASRRETTDGAALTVAVIIPAHNMEKCISRCVRALQSSALPEAAVRIYVIADHCTDETVQRARQAGATVLERTVTPAGKTFALAWALEQLAHRSEGADRYVITDATAWVEPGFLAAMVGGRARNEAIVTGRAVAAIEDQPWFVHCLGLTLVHRNFQNECRERLGLSSLIEGRAMAFDRSYVQRFGWSLALPTSRAAGAHPTEDWRHGVRVVEHGYRVAFAGGARVKTPLRETLAAATQQGARWERGRMENALTHGLRLLMLGLRGGNRLQVFAALDAIQPPVAILGAFTILVAGTTAICATGGAIDLLGYAPLALVGVYGVVIAIQGRKEGIRPATIAWAPAYIVWRSFAFVAAWFRK